MEFASGNSKTTSSKVSSISKIGSRASLENSIADGADMVRQALNSSHDWFEQTISHADTLAVPDDMVFGLVDDEKLEKPMKFDVLSDRWSELVTRGEERDRFLEQMMNDDMVEASIFIATSTDDVENEADQAEFKANKNNEFPKTCKFLKAILRHSTLNLIGPISFLDIRMHTGSPQRASRV